ncbi:MAG TPA: MscL family protein, partial [Arthrobacter sp.]|nr:MscL family protein [Arthrobacter sp.]
WAGNDKTFLNFGGVITAFVTFLITAAVVYFIFVAPMNRINQLVKKRLATAEPEEKPLPADTALLAEIRDLLARLAGPEPSHTATHTASNTAVDAFERAGGHTVGTPAAGERSR